MGKFYVREVGLGQTNLLLAVLVLTALACWMRGRDVAAGALLAAAAVVKPYAVLFLPYLVARRKWNGVASFAAVLLGALALPAVPTGGPATSPSFTNGGSSSPPPPRRT